MKPSGQFSRRHHTDDAHRAAQANRQARLELKQLLIDEQVARTAARTPEEYLEENEDYETIEDPKIK
tara:strand:- start:791 stop:991 length:201 start_codon:yes stop_codon:yes gene_type:complete